ncbi:MAG: hypothetical protein JW863_22755 [Chitinispirillaceae bacterium]|nr:hypothetical protein [Chitinispirillaceae bacterium]
MKTIFFTPGCRIALFLFFLVYGSGVFSASIPGRTYTSKNRRISTFVCDEHAIWGGTGAEGVIRIDKVTGETSLHILSDSGSPGNAVRSLAMDENGALLVGVTVAGIIRLDGSKWERIAAFSDDQVLGMLIDGQEKIWAWTGNSGILRYDNGAWQPIVAQFSGVFTNDPEGDVWIMSVPPDGDSGCGDAWIREYVDGEPQAPVSLASICPELFYQKSLAIDTKGNCWIGALNKLIQLSGESIRTFIANTDTNSRTYCTVLAANSDDMILIAAITYVSGLFSDAKIFLYDQQDENPFDSAVATWSDRYNNFIACTDEPEGCFWLSANDGTVLMVDTSGHMTPFATGNAVLPANSITALSVDKADNLWAATTGGIARYRDTAWTVYPAPGDSFPGNDACCLVLDSSGIVWAGFRQPLASSVSSTGISCFDGEQWRMLFRSHFSQKAIAVDKTGDQWVVAEDGIYRYHGLESEKLYTVQSDAGFDTTMNAIAIDGNNTPWIGTDRGLTHYENGVWIDDTAFNRQMSDREDSVSTATAEVNAICFHDGIAWIGTAGGLFRREGDDCTLIDTAGGVLPDPCVQCIFVDTANSVWVGTRRGLVHLNGEQHTSYTTENTPLCDDDITACVVARSGNVWVGTRRGGLTVLQGAGLTAAAGTPVIRTRSLRPVDISCRVMPHGACRISIRTGSPAVIGFYVVSLSGKLLKRFGPSPAGVRSVDFIWDGTDRFNRPVSAGVYPGIVTGNGTIIGSKIVRR